MTRRGCGCCDGSTVVGYCCGSVGPLVENYVDSLTLGQQSSSGNWSLVELVSTPLLLVPSDGYQWLGSLYNGSFYARDFPCFAANFDFDFTSGIGTQLSGAWDTSIFFGPWDPFFSQNAGRNVLGMNSAGMSLFFGTSISGNVPLVGASTTSVRGPLLFQISASSGTGSLQGTSPSGRQSLLSSTTFNVKVNDGGTNNQPYGVLTLRNALIARYCWPFESPCNWANATLTNGQWARTGQSTETQSGTASFMYDLANSFWYLNVPYTSSSGSGVWKIRESGTNGGIDVYRNSNSLPLNGSFTVPSGCNGTISMQETNQGSASVLSFTVANSTACESCNDG